MRMQTQTGGLNATHVEMTAIDVYDSLWCMLYYTILILAMELVSAS